MTDGSVLGQWFGAQTGRIELLLAAALGLLLILLVLNAWLLVDRRRRRSAERDLYARLTVLETEREIARMARARRAVARGEGEDEAPNGLGRLENPQEAAAAHRRQPADNARPALQAPEAGSRDRPRDRGAGVAARLSALTRVDRLPSAAMVTVGVVSLGIMVVHLLHGSGWWMPAAAASACCFLSARLTTRRRS